VSRGPPVLLQCIQLKSDFFLNIFRAGIENVFLRLEDTCHI
jgi:hypothetical protein